MPFTGERSHKVSENMQKYVGMALSSEPTGSPGYKGQIGDLRQTIKDMLETIGFKPHGVPFLVSGDLESALHEELRLLDLETQALHQAEQRLQLSASLTHQAWTSLEVDLKVVVAKQMLYMFLIDDFAETFMDSLMSFGQRFIVHAPQGNCILQAFDDHLRGLGTWYGPYSVTVIVKNSLEYVTGRFVEHQMLASDFDFCPETKLLPVFLRPRVGGSEILSHMVYDQSRFPEDQFLLQYLPAVPAMMQFMDYINDVLSYYKEFVLGDERFNFVANFAASHGLSQMQTLCGLACHVVEARMSCRQILCHDDRLLEVFDQWVKGFIQLYTAHQRYHLVELFADEGYLPPYREGS